MKENHQRSALDLLMELRELSEHERIEAKRGSSISRSVMETVCAFANEPHLDGGWLLLGVEEDRSTLFTDFKVAGIADTFSSRIAEPTRSWRAFCFITFWAKQMCAGSRATKNSICATKMRAP